MRKAFPRNSSGVNDCPLQLTKCTQQVLKGDSNAWQTHLQGARALIQNIQSCFAVPTSSFKRGRPASVPVPFSRDEFIHPIYLAPSAITALDFFTTAFVWFDTLSCVTTGLKPSCPDWLLPVLHNEDGRIQLCKLMGCKNWVMVDIMEIAALDEWKGNCIYNGVLCMRELTRRAARIEERLKNGLATNKTALLSFEADPYGEMNLEVGVVTNIFGCSALTYLHVVLSGAHPELPEIRESVLGTIEAFHALPEAQWVRNLAWPFCVAGCMAMTQDEGDVMNIACGANLHGQGFRIFEAAAAIVEECWAARRRSEGSSACDWKTAMKTLGVNVLLV